MSKALSSDLNRCNNMDSVETIQQEASQKTVYISLPQKHMTSLEDKYELDHGLVIKEMNSHINEGYLKAYFREWGSVTQSKINKASASEREQTLAYVRFSTKAEADRADWAGPHYIGGTEVKVRRVVSVKGDDDLEEEREVLAYIPRARQSLGLGYLLDDAQWLDDI